MSAPSAKPLFQAIKPKQAVDGRQHVMDGLPTASAPATSAPRDPLDFDPTPPEATRAFLAAEMEFIRAHGDDVCETAVGAGHIAKVLQETGFRVWGNDVVDRGWPGVWLCSFFDMDERVAEIQITNPPYGEISAGNSGGRWLRHSLGLGFGYTALLLGAEWPFGRANGFGGLIETHPPSIEYACTWKIDFRGQGRPAQRNCWFVWDTNRPGRADGSWIRKRLHRDGNVMQASMDLGGDA